MSVRWIAPYRKNLSSDLYRTYGFTHLMVNADFVSTRVEESYPTEEFETIVLKLHEEGFSVCTMVNRMFTQEELPVLDVFFERCRKLDVGAIYFSDPCCILMAGSYGLTGKLVFNQDTILTNSKDIQAYLDTGIGGCTISREITLEEVLYILDHVKGNLELMGFGHMNLSYSKRPLVQNYFAYIQSDCDPSAYYELEEESRKERFVVEQHDQGTHIFTKDLLEITDELPLLKEHGLQGVRIEDKYLSDAQVAEAMKWIASGGSIGAWKERFPEDSFTKGYFYEKTNITK